MLTVWIALATVVSPGDAVKFFPGTYAEALERATRDERPVFVELFTEWCPACKALDRTVYADPEVIALLNAQVVALKLDAEKGEGLKIAKQLHVDAYPTAVILGPGKHQELDRISGCLPPDQYLATLREILAGDTLEALRAKANASPNDLALWFRLATRLDDQGAEPEDCRPAWERVAALDPDDQTEHGPRARFELAALAASGYWARARTLQPMIDLAARYDQKPIALDAHASLAAERGHSSDPVSRRLAVPSFEYLLAHGARTAELLNDYAWLLAAHLPNTPESLAKALALAQEAVQLESDPSYLDTLAECHWRLGQREEAVAAARKAVDAADADEKRHYTERLHRFEVSVPPEKKP